MIHIRTTDGRLISVDTTLADFRTNHWRPARSGDGLIEVHETLVNIDHITVVESD